MALALKNLSYKRESSRLSSHGELWEYVSKLVEETHDEELGRLWRSVSSMHVNFYGGWDTEKHVKGAIEDAESFIEKVKKLL